MRSLVLALALAACASATSPADDLAPLGVTLACNAEEDYLLHADGRREGEPGQTLFPVAVTLPAAGAAGTFCIATGCEPARIERVALSRTPEWAARVWTGDIDRGVVTVSDARTNFVLTNPEDDGAVRVWAGSCAPAGS